MYGAARLTGANLKYRENRLQMKVFKFKQFVLCAVSNGEVLVILKLKYYPEYYYRRDRVYVPTNYSSRATFPTFLFFLILSFNNLVSVAAMFWKNYNRRYAFFFTITFIISLLNSVALIIIDFV